MLETKRISMQEYRGFTLVEIAIVLMIIGLLIGGILRGQELITSARVRNIIDQKTAVQVAYIGFIDRYRMYPGALTQAQADIVGNGAGGGSWGGGNSIPSINTNNLGLSYAPVAFQNLTVAGFLSCGVCTTAVPALATADNLPVNAYGGLLRFGMGASSAAAVPPNTVHAWYYSIGPGVVSVLLAQGASIESQVLAEVDRKADDGRPGTGQMRYGAADSNAGTAACTEGMVGSADGGKWANPSTANCELYWLY
jgi:prepilin-type N-terminal cleavage/methylation domain-containing protein